MYFRCIALAYISSSCFLFLQPIFPWDDPERDPESSRAVHGHGAGRGAEPNPTAAGQRGVPFSRYRHQPAADVQRHPGTAAECRLSEHQHIVVIFQIRCAVFG